MTSRRIARSGKQTSPPKRLALTIESTLENVNLAETLIVQFSEGAGYSEQQRGEIELAVREAVVNAVLHGNRCDATKKGGANGGTARFRVGGSIKDEGEGFDPGSLPDPLNPENLLRRAGRGIFLMKSSMDEVNMRRRGLLWHGGHHD